MAELGETQSVAVFRDALHRYQSSAQQQPATIKKANLATLFRLLTQLMASGEPIAELSSNDDPDEVCLLGPAIGKIRQGLRRAGFELDVPATGLAMIGDDPEVLIELEELLRESLFQLRKTLLEMHRRLGNRSSDRPGHTATRQWLGETEQQLDGATRLLS